MITSKSLVQLVKVQPTSNQLRTVPHVILFVGNSFSLDRYLVTDSRQPSCTRTSKKCVSLQSHLANAKFGWTTAMDSRQRGRKWEKAFPNNNILAQLGHEHWAWWLQVRSRIGQKGTDGIRRKLGANCAETENGNQPEEFRKSFRIELKGIEQLRDGF